MSNCTGYEITEDPPDRQHPCHCPICKGFIKWIEKEGEGWQPVCNKCKTPLTTVPDSESTESWEFGKICALKPLKNNPVEEQNPKSQLSKDNLSTCGVDPKQKE